MSTTLTEKKEKTTPLATTRRGPTSMFIDRILWIKVRRVALDLGITATEFVEEALKEKLVEVGKKDG